jgi:hypothetical protein
MYQPHPSDPDPDGWAAGDLDPWETGDPEDDLELGTPVYEGTGLSVRALTAEELDRFLAAHAGQPAQLLGAGWEALQLPARPTGGPLRGSPDPLGLARSAGSRPCPPGRAWPRAAGTADPAAPPSRPTGSGVPPSWPPGPARPAGGPPPSSPPPRSPPSCCRWLAWTG